MTLKYSAIRTDVDNSLVPLYLCATLGTTSTLAVDPIRSLSEVAKRYGIWVHVEAAFAGNALICPEHRHFMDGVENVDSFSINARKWLFTALSCCCLLVRNPSALTRSLSTDPEYLRNNASSEKKVVDFKDWQIGLTRRFQSIKLWLVLRSYGIDNLVRFQRFHIEMAKHFESMVAEDNMSRHVITAFHHIQTHARI